MLERRRSWLVPAIVVALVVGLAAVLVARVAGGDDEAATPTTAPASTTSTSAELAPDGPNLARLDAASALPEPIWLLAGRSRSENTMQLYRIDADGDRRVNVATGQGQLPGVRFRAIRADDAIVWSNGDNLFRIDEDLSLIPFTLGPAAAVFPSTDEQVWTLDAENVIFDTPLTPDRQPEELGQLPSELIAALSEALFLLRAQGGVGLWAGGLQPAYVGDSLLAVSSDQVFLSGRRDGEPAIVVAQAVPFAVTSTVPLDVDGVPLGDGALSPDGELVAFHLQRGGRIELAVADVADGTTTSLGVFTDRAAPVWLDDGRLVAIGAPTGDTQVVWLLSPGTGEPSVPILELDAGRAWTLAGPTA